MKVCFINCQSNHILYLNLGLAYLAGSLSQRHQVWLIDFNISLNRAYKKFVLDKIEKKLPDVVGFSVNSFNFNYALEIAQMIKHRYPFITVVFGGVHPTLFPDATLKYPGVDAVCIGEGEESFLEYVDKLEQGGDYTHTGGIWCKDSKGAVVKNELRPFVANLDALPFPRRDIFDLAMYIKYSFLSSLPFLASRGCPYNCSFCSAPVIREIIPGNYVRLRSPKYVLEEIEENVIKFWKKGFRCIDFIDDYFGFDIDWLYEFCHLFKKANLHKRLNWSCHTRADIISEEWAKIVSEAGCVMVGVGVESGDEEIRTKIYNKQITDKQIIKALEYLKKYKIVPLMYFIFGCCEESKNSVNKSLKLMKRFPNSVVHIFKFQPLPKTKLGEAIRERFEIKGNLIQTWNQKKFLKKTNKIIIKLQRLNLAKESFRSICIGKTRFLMDYFKFFLRSNKSYRDIKNFLHLAYIKYIVQKSKGNKLSHK